MNKLKVAWICHFSNNEVRARLPLSELKLKNWIKTLLGKQINTGYADFAPWVTNLIKEFEKYDDVELHVISPFLGLTHFTYEFKMRNVNYHFFQPAVPIFHIPYNRLNIKGCPVFFVNRHYVKKFLRNIKPDIVNLIGTENPYYSVTSLDIENIPVYVSAQTVYTNPDRLRYADDFLPLNWDVELKIHQKEKYFGCGGRMHRDLILRNNPNATIFKMFFPIEKPKKVKALPKIFDFVFFAAGVAKKKGVEDAIDALALVKKSKSDVTLNIVGSCANEYKTFLLNKISDLNLGTNIIFTDYFPNHADMHQHVVQARYALLPVKLDIIPGSIIEAIYLDLPVVTYKTTGTPYLNRDGESVLLCGIGDIEGLSKNMIALLETSSLAEKLRQNARAFVEREFDNAVSAKRLVSNYRTVIDHYHRNIPIPQEQLFDINEFPIY